MNTSKINRSIANNCYTEYLVIADNYTFIFNKIFIHNSVDPGVGILIHFENNNGSYFNIHNINSIKKIEKSLLGDVFEISTSASLNLNKIIAR